MVIAGIIQTVGAVVLSYGVITEVVIPVGKAVIGLGM